MKKGKTPEQNHEAIDKLYETRKKRFSVWFVPIIKPWCQGN